MTWGDIKQITLQKIDEAGGADAKELELLMWPAANEALQILSTCGKYIVRSFEILQDGKKAGRIRYNLRELAPNFYDMHEVFFEQGNECARTLDYHVEGNYILAIDGNICGKWIVYYNAYPTEITSETSTSAQIDVDSEVAILIPLYIASQIFKFDDISLATMWRNEFEAGRDMLLSKTQSSGQGQAEFLKERWQ